MPTAQSQQIMSFHDPATTVLPVRTLRIPVGTSATPSPPCGVRKGDDRGARGDRPPEESAVFLRVCAIEEDHKQPVPDIQPSGYLWEMGVSWACSGVPYQL